MRVVWVIALLGAWMACADEPVCPMGAEWRFDAALSDSFDGEGLDDAKWWDFNPAWHGRKPGYFARENVAVHDGKLLLTARALKPDEVSVENQVRGHDKFSTATVKSKQRIRYGYFEARCKSMDAGLCNAFWLYDPLDAPEKYREGSFSEEIDIFEVFGKPPKPKHQRLCYMTVHRMHTPYVEALVNAKRMKLPDSSAKRKMDFDFQDDFHVYALLWTPEELRWFVDGKELFSRKNDHFHTALHIMFDCEVMEAWVGLPDPADLPATFEIDYLRVWRLPEKENTPPIAP